VNESIGLSKAHSGVNNIKIAFLDSWLNKGAVLDAGCGNGLYGLHCADKGCDVVQVDVQDRRNKKATCLKFLSANIEGFNWPANSFESIIAFDVIEHLNDDIAFMRQAKKWLRRGGRLILSVPNEDNSMLEPYGLAHVHFTDKTHRREYSVDSLRELADSWGFKVLTIEAHYNMGLCGVVRNMRGTSFVSGMISELTYLQLKVFQKFGLLRSRVVADWFAVFENNN